MCARERSSSNGSGQIEATQLKSVLAALRSTPLLPALTQGPAAWRQGLCSQDCKPMSVTARRRALPQWPRVKEGRGRNWRTSGRMTAWPPPRSALVPTRGCEERLERPGLPRSCGARQLEEQHGSWAEQREDTEDGESKGRPGTPAVVTGRAAGKIGRRRAASEAKPETVEQKMRNPEAG